MRLDINLATRPYEDPRHFWLRWGGTLGVLILLTLVLVYSAFTGWYTAAKDRKLIHEREQQIAQREQEKQKDQALLNLPQNRSIRDRSEFLNNAFERKAFSWTRVFQDLEQVMPARLHLVSIRPESSPDHPLALTLVVAGESRERAIELVRNMENSRHFQQTQIEEETTATSAVPGDNVQFDISSLYVPESGALNQRSAH
jgi:type IV pilus assembly protein PilN